MAKIYMITYDLNNPGQRYHKVINIIKDNLSNGIFCDYWKSAFIIKSDFDADTMIKKLEPYLDKNDKIIIVEVTNNKNYQGLLSKKEWNYIDEHVFCNESSWKSII